MGNCCARMRTLVTIAVGAVTLVTLVLSSPGVSAVVHAGPTAHTSSSTCNGVLAKRHGCWYGPLTVDDGGYWIANNQGSVRGVW